MKVLALLGGKVLEHPDMVLCRTGSQHITSSRDISHGIRRFLLKWARILVAYHDAPWLEARRPAGPGGKPGIRLNAGKPTVRWEEGFLFAVQSGC